MEIQTGMSLESEKTIDIEKAKKTALDLHFIATPNDGDEGLALRGFYVTRKESKQSSFNLC
jgi:hypothetical protein